MVILLKKSMWLWLLVASAKLVYAETSSIDTQLFTKMQLANKAQLVEISRKQLITKSLSQGLANALLSLDKAPLHTGNYLEVERFLVDTIGAKASNLHLGRSRNDLGETMYRMVIREALLSHYEKIQLIRQAILDLALQHKTTLMPGITHAVQAQPTHFGHYLLALDAQLYRDAVRIQQQYKVVNLSPLGAGALTGSGFPLDRESLADLLGFDGIITNTYDAIVLSSVDSKLGSAQALSSLSLTLGRFAQDILLQYSELSPGFYLAESMTRRSSLMPQKRNPGSLERVRHYASQTIGAAHAVLLLAHNTPMYEVRDIRFPMLEQLSESFEKSKKMLAYTLVSLQGLQVDAEALETKVLAEFSTMTELADILYKEAGIPFRDGYAFSSALSSLARKEGLTIDTVSYKNVSSLFSAMFEQAFPLDNAALRKALDARTMIANRAVIGSPNLSSIEQMIEQQQEYLKENQQWFAFQHKRLASAHQRLDQAFLGLTLNK